MYHKFMFWQVWRSEVWPGSYWAEIRVTAGLHSSLELPGTILFFEFLAEFSSWHLQDWSLVFRLAGSWGLFLAARGHSQVLAVWPPSYTLRAKGGLIPSHASNLFCLFFHGISFSLTPLPPYSTFQGPSGYNEPSQIIWDDVPIIRSSD